MIQSDNLIQISIGFARSLFSLVIYFTLVLPVTQAQSNIHGKIVDSIGKPIPNANVLLLNFADSVLVKGLLSSEDGQYSFENIKTGRYNISATHTGNNPAYSPHFEVTDKQENIDMG